MKKSLTENIDLDAVEFATPEPPLSSLSYEELLKRCQEFKSFYEMEIRDWADADDEVKRIASQVLSKDELDGAPFYDRFIGVIDVVEMLVKRIKELENKNENSNSR